MLKGLICLLAGTGAGLGMGFAGMSAAVIISPVLITFLGLPAYEAVGCALASDVLASAVSAYTYGKNKNLDLRNGIFMVLTMLLFTLFGSYVASLAPNRAMGNVSIILTILLGIKFILKPVQATKESMQTVNVKKRMLQCIFSSMIVGFICGFAGLGGGMILLVILTELFGYELKMAVGTSVFIMTFTSLTGAVSHFLLGDMPDLKYLLVCMLSTFVWARVASRFANKVHVGSLNRVLGGVLVLLGTVVLVVNRIK